MTVIAESESIAYLCPMLNSSTETDEHCIGKECMAWRWAQAYYEENTQPMGYCGLAGRPAGVFK